MSDTIWLPGSGAVPLHIRQAEKALEEYDRRLSLGRDERNGDWVVLLDGGDGRPYPVLGLGTELPAPERVKEKLYRADTSRRGTEIVNELVKRNDARLHKIKDKASDGAGIAAEAYEWAFRKVGSDAVNPRIFVPS
jgi:hypothetical protein